LITLPAIFATPLIIADIPLPLMPPLLHTPLRCHDTAIAISLIFSPLILLLRHYAFD